jgi:hypothetical protein
MNKQIDYQSVFHLIISHSHCPEAYPFHIICPFFHIFFFRLFAYLFNLFGPTV